VNSAATRSSRFWMVNRVPEDTGQVSLEDAPEPTEEQPEPEPEPEQEENTDHIALQVDDMNIKLPVSIFPSIPQITDAIVFIGFGDQIAPEAPVMITGKEAFVGLSEENPDIAVSLAGECGDDKQLQEMLLDNYQPYLENQDQNITLNVDFKRLVPIPPDEIITIPQRGDIITFQDLKTEEDKELLSNPIGLIVKAYYIIQTESGLKCELRLFGKPISNDLGGEMDLSGYNIFIMAASRIIPLNTDELEMVPITGDIIILSDLKDEDDQEISDIPFIVQARIHTLILGEDGQFVPKVQIRLAPVGGDGD